MSGMAPSALLFEWPLLMCEVLCIAAPLFTLAVCARPAIPTVLARARTVVRCAAVAAVLCGACAPARPGRVGVATRIVSLSPAFTELLFAIGAGDRVVGRTRWGDYPPAASAVPSVGDGLAPNVEAVAARRPDLGLP